MSDSPELWRRYSRRGEVTATKRSHDWTWTTAAGETMAANAGDWDVTDATGNQRSVAAGIFEATHERIGPGRYKRCGTVLAKLAIPGELMRTLEGDATAQQGDWIVQGEHGEYLPVPHAHFVSAYAGPLEPERVR